MLTFLLWLFSILEHVTYRNIAIVVVAWTVLGLLWRLFGPTCKLILAGWIVVPAMWTYSWCVKTDPLALARAISFLANRGKPRGEFVSAKTLQEIWRQKLQGGTDDESSATKARPVDLSGGRAPDNGPGS